MKIPRLVFMEILLLALFGGFASAWAAGGIPAVSDKVKILPETRNGFVHPGLGLSQKNLETARNQVLAGREPWLSYWKEFAAGASGKHVVLQNESRSRQGEPETDAWNGRAVQSNLEHDGGLARSQALMYFFTGDEAYRRNALHIIRVWSKMNPSKYRPYPDCQIHSPLPLHSLLQAAEIIRHTSTENPDLEWKPEYTEALERNLIRPAIGTFMNWNGWFMNQHNFAIMGSISGFIFLDDRKGYDQRVEWFTVNKDAPDPGRSGSIKHLARLVTHDATTGKAVEPRVQLVEMGRDQPHSAGDLNLFAYIANVFENQGTLVDPVSGTPSKARNAVPVMEFLDHRILKAADYYCRYMLGYDTPWTPTPQYRTLSEADRGRWDTFDFWRIWEYYALDKGWNLSKIAPYLDRMYRLRFRPSNWLLLPANAKGPALRFVPFWPQNDVIAIVDRSTPLDAKTKVRKENDRRFLRVKTDPSGARIALLSCATGSRRLAMRVRTDGGATIRFSDLTARLVLPDTRGEWRNVVFAIPPDEWFGNCHFLTVVGKEGTTVDLEAFVRDAEKTLRPPRLDEAEKRISFIACAGIPASLPLHSDGRGTFRTWGAPDGVEIDSKGVLSFQMRKDGNDSFLAGVDDGTTVVLCEISLRTGKNRADAIRLASARRRAPDSGWRKTTLLELLRAKTKARRLRKNGSDEAFMTAIKELREAADALEPLTPRLPDGTMDYTKIVSSELGGTIHSLADGKTGTAPSYWFGRNMHYLLDFGANYRVFLDSVSMQAWMIPSRAADATVFGSVDGWNWDRLTPGEMPWTEDAKTLEVAPEFRKKGYRFLKLAKTSRRSANIFTIAELRLDGRRVQINDSVERVSISSPEALCGRIGGRASVRIDVDLCEPVRDLRASIAGVPAKIVKKARGFTAEADIPASTKPGRIGFAIDYVCTDGKPAATIDWTTDGTELFRADDATEIRDMMKRTRLIDTTPGRPEQQTRWFTGALFDGKHETFSEYRSERGGCRSGIAFDFGTSPVAVTHVELLPRQGSLFTRIEGTRLQGSQDGQAWTDLTWGAAKVPGWQTLHVRGEAKTWRYYRLMNDNFWYGSMSEVRFHEKR